MKIYGICMTKNSEDIIYHFLLHALEEGLDGIIVADNMSTDNTLSEINKAKSLNLGRRHIEILEDNEVGYYQSKKMTRLAQLAHEKFGADWIIPMDDDEIWYSKTGSISETIKALPKNINVITADLYNHFPTAIDVPDIVPFKSLVWRQQKKGALPKVAIKYHKGMVIEQGNHSVTYPVSIHSSNVLEIRHFPYRTWEQFKNKAVNGLKAYQATDLPEDMGGHWRSYGKLIEKWGDEVVEREVFRKYFYFFSPTDNEMVCDPAPFRRWLIK